MERTGEEAFFTVMGSSDIWSHLKEHMYPGKETSNFYDYRDGDLACKYGYISLIKERDDLDYTVFAMCDAASGAHLEVIRWLLINKHDIEMINPMPYAILAGSYEIIEWLHYNCNYQNEDCDFYCAFDHAVDEGHFDIAKFLYDVRGEKCGALAMAHAAKNNDLEMLMWLHNYCKAECSPEAITYAVKNGNLEMIKFINDNISVRWPSSVMDLAAKNGNINMLRWLHKNKSSTLSCSFSAGNFAAENDHVHVLNWLLKHYPKFNKVSLTHALEGGSISAVKWFYEKIPGLKDSAAMDSAVSSGSIELVEWLSANHNGSFTEHAIAIAARKGFIHMLDWLNDKGQRCTAYAASLSVVFGQLETIKWIFQNANDICNENLLFTAINSEMYNIFVWLYEYGFNNPNVLYSRLMRRAIKREQIDIVEWLNERRPLECAEDFVPYAVSFDNPLIIQALCPSF